MSKKNKISASHILVMHQESQNSRSELTSEEAKKKIDDIYKEIKNNTWIKKAYIEIIFPNTIKILLTEIAKGVLPVPPIVKFPTTITGRFDEKELILFFKNFLLLLDVKYENKREKGYNKYNHRLLLYQLSTTKLLDDSSSYSGKNN